MKSKISKILYFKINKGAFIIITLALLISFGIICATVYPEIYQLYEVYTIRKNNDTDLVKPHEKIKIKYNLPVSQEKAENSFSIYPNTPGKINWESNYILNYSKTLVFTPDEYFDDNQTYNIKIGNIESIFGTQLLNRAYSFTTVKPFNIVETYPNNDEENINVNPEFKVIVNGVGDYFQFKFKLDPKTELETKEVIEENGQTIYSFKNKTQLEQGIGYSWKIKQIYTPNKKEVNNKTYHFTTQPPLQISKIMPYENDENVHINRKIILTFNKQVDHEEIERNLEITPETKGTTEWKGNTLIFTPENKLAKNTEYKIRVMDGIKSPEDDSFLKGDQIFAFKTKNTDRYPPKPTWEPAYKEGKYIHVSLANQTLYAYEDGELIDSFLISSGTSGFPTPTGDFKIFSKARAARMAGFYGEGNPNNYDLPGVPYVLAFSGPYTIHGTYWHSNFGHPMSHGCVNMYTPDSKWVYDWAPINTPTVVQ